MLNGILVRVGEVTLTLFLTVVGFSLVPSRSELSLESLDSCWQLTFVLAAAVTRFSRIGDKSGGVSLSSSGIDLCALCQTGVATFANELLSFISFRLVFLPSLESTFKTFFGGIHLGVCDRTFPLIRSYSVFLAYGWCYRNRTNNRVHKRLDVISIYSSKEITTK